MTRNKVLGLMFSLLVAVCNFSVIAGDWIYDGTTNPKTIRDAAENWSWKLKVAGPVTDGALTIGVYNASAIVDSPSSESKVLDLRNMTVDGVPVTALTLGASAFGSSPMTEFYANHIASDLTGTFAQSLSLLRMELEGSGITKLAMSSGGWGFAEKCNTMTNVVINAPNLKDIGESAFKNCLKLNCPFVDFINSEVTNIGMRAFAYAPIKHDLVLNNIDAIGAEAFIMSGITGLYINGGKLTNLPDSSNGDFYYCTSLTSMVIKAENFVSFGAKAVRDCGKLKTLYIGSKQPVVFLSNSCNASLTSVTFEGPAATVESLDNLLSGVIAREGKKDCTLWLPLKTEYSSGWAALASPLVDGDEKNNKPKRCIGVYRDGLRKAYMAYARPFGLALIVR